MGSEMCIRDRISSVIDLLAGIPSIVYGAFAFTIMIYLGLKTSLGGGIIVITLLIIPIFIRSMDEIARELPQDMLNDEYWRWLYTAITRARERVYFINFKEEFFEQSGGKEKCLTTSEEKLKHWRKQHVYLVF